MTDKKNTKQAEMSRKALEMKKVNEVDAEFLTEHEKTTGQGQVQVPNKHNPVMGALDAEGYEPVLRRSRHER